MRGGYQTYILKRAWMKVDLRKSKICMQREKVVAQQALKEDSYLLFSKELVRAHVIFLFPP